MRYQSHADMGGELGHDRVTPEMDEPVFHADWERQIFGLAFGLGITGLFNADRIRSAFETLVDYRSLSYYQIWARGCEKLLLEEGLVAADEIEAGRKLYPERNIVRALRVSDVSKIFETGSSQRSPNAPAEYVVGEQVRMRAEAVSHHTRLPAYARGKHGRIESVRGVYIFPDTHAHDLGEQPQWLYTIVFTGRELWGDGATEKLHVSIDAWEPYFERPT
jgi:nitrile hydratase